MGRELIGVPGYRKVSPRPVYGRRVSLEGNWWNRFLREVEVSEHQKNKKRVKE